jgi:acetyltransferase EpsM
MTTSAVLVVGCGGHARFVISILHSCKVTIDGLIDTGETFDPKEKIMGLKVIGTILELIEGKFIDTHPVIAMAIGDNALREVIYSKTNAAGYSTLSLIHPSAIVEHSAIIGNGNVIGPNAVIGAEVSIGANNIINSAAVIEHQSKIGSHCHIAPNATICGKVTVGDSSLVGANSAITPNISIAANTIIGAGTTVIQNVHEENKTIVGAIARELY